MIEASVVVSYVDSKATLPKLLQCLENQTYPKEKFEIILVDGDSCTPRASQARGQIIGINKSKGNVIFLTDSDRFPPPNWISEHMKNYPQYDLVAGNVTHHVTKQLHALNFGNFSAKREVLERISIRDIPSQQDADFALRFIKQRIFKGTITNVEVYEPESGRWTWKHQFLMARNHMVLFRRYRMFPTVLDFRFRLRHPAILFGTIAGFIANPYLEGLFAGLFTNEVVNAHV